MKQFGQITAALVSLAVAGLASAAEEKKTHQAPKIEGKGECHGINSCKGKGECGGPGYDCAGNNSCKGQGWISTTKAECKKKGGKFKS